MIRSLLKRTKFHRAAFPLLAMLLTTTTAWAEKEAVTYIKADGTSGTQEAIILTGNENEIGSYNQTTWYVVKNTQEGVDVAYTKPKTLYGTVNIILEDGAEMTATSGGTTIWGVDGSTLNIYGQVNGTGRLSSESTAHQAISINGDINIYGGVISASATESNTRQAILANNASVNIYGGTVTATSSSGIAIRATTAVNIYGGAVTATGYQGISAGSITLGWTDPDDYIKSNNYYITGEGHITIADGKTFYDGTGTSYASGTATANSIAGKTLRTYDYRTVSFNSNGGSAVDEQIIAVNGKATEPTAPTREGYTFVRWLKDGASYDFSSNVTANIALTATWATEVAYIDATGTSETHKATILTGSETTLPAGWYVVNSDITYTGTVTFNGNATIILADNCTMNVGTSENRISGIGISCINDADLIIYGQTLDDAQAGCLNVYSVSNSTQDYASIYVSGNYTQHSGSVYINHSGYDGAGICAQNLTLNGGRLNVNSAEKSAINLGWNITINGGKLDAIGNSQRYGIICSNGGMTLGYTNASDYIHVSKYNAGKSNVTIAPGRKLTDDTNVYRGVLSSTQISALANQTLTPKEWIWEGDGSVTAPYQITDSDDLFLLGLNVNQGETYEDKYFKLKGDISLTHTTDYNDATSTENNFPMIGGAYQKNGFWYHKFQGHFDGNNKTISGIRIYKGGNGHVDGNVGLFGTLGEGAVVKDLKLADSRITGFYYTGGIVGENFGGTITNCHVNSDVCIHAVKSGASSHGGIVGGNMNYETPTPISTITNCTSMVKLTIADGVASGTTGYGGIVGTNQGTLADNYAEGAIIPAVSNHYGGVVGQNDVSDIRNYYKECTIAGVPRQTNMACGNPDVNGGRNVMFKLVTNGKKIGDADALTLQISGNGDMADYSETQTAPWAAQCSNITEISLGENIYSIGTYAFAYCNRVNEVIIPENIEYIYDNAFKGMTALKKVYIMNVNTDYSYMTHIDGSPFADCSSDFMINVANASVIAAYTNANEWKEKYGSKFYAEGYCGDENVNDGKNIKWSLMPIAGEYINFGSEAHPNKKQAYALSITKHTDAENANLAMKNNPGSNNWLDGNDQYCICRRIKTATIEEGITNIGTWAFSNCVNLETVAVPSTVSAIGEYAFYDCHKLVGVNIPEGVTSIGDETFNSCESLTSIDIPSTVTSIGRTAFYYCNSLTNIIIPSNVETIATSAFKECRSLKTVRVMATTPPTIANYGDNGQYAPFYYCTSLKYIFVPNVDAYSAAYGWNSTTEKNNILPLLRADKTTLFAQDASNTYMTWCDEFEWKKPENCTVYTVSGVNSEQVQVAEVEGDVIPAYTPVLIKRAEGKLNDDIKAKFSTVHDATTEWIHNFGPFYTCNTNEDLAYKADDDVVTATIKAGDYNLWFLGNVGNGSTKVTEGYVFVDSNPKFISFALRGDKFLEIDSNSGGIPAHRCILTLNKNAFGSANAATRSLTIGVGGDTTGMEELKNEKIEELNSEWYDLQGRKLGSKPTRKGLYINNGKKIVIK